ncbi:hypothetical protein BJV82DRAFT_631342 [Fennellomyces sp. T-0311]|nr:hypothetical protein BJV82DRAFT_631342 [Fennellomyces sp. T-0311]
MVWASLLSLLCGLFLLDISIFVFSACACFPKQTIFFYVLFMAAQQSGIRCGRYRVRETWSAGKSWMPAEAHLGVAT